MQIDTVLFDLGGVLAPDVWETLLITPRGGLADRLGLDIDEVTQAGQVLWPYYGTRPTLEPDYWSDLGGLLSVQIPQSIVSEIEEQLLLPNPAAGRTLSAVRNAGCQIGIVSNNTSFWYPKQVRLLDLKGYIWDNPLVFLSFEEGVLKEDRHGLFETVAGRLTPHNTLIIDDRHINVLIARSLGFVAFEYSLGSNANDLAGIITGLLHQENLWND